MREKYRSIIFWILLLIAAGVTVINGATSEVSLGDESHHYRFAQNILSAGRRVAFDPLYESGNPPGFFYGAPPLWHFILAFLWKITGGVSQTIAQIYHILFFILLVWLISLLAKETGGEEGRWFSALIIATVPMVVSFSTLFYMDVPMTALSTLGFYLILKKRYIEAGAALGLAYFTKLNSAFFFPGFLLVIFWNERKKFAPLLRGLMFFILPILMVYIPDNYWRNKNIASRMDTISLSSISHYAFGTLEGTRVKEYLNSYVTNPIDMIKYFGVAVLVIIFFYLFRFRQWDKKVLVLWIPIISYLVLFVIIFGVESDIRYLLPIPPFLVVLSVPSFISTGKKWQLIIVGVCVLQFLSTIYYVHQRRQILPEVVEAFGYIRKNVPESALILYPEENLLIYTQRRMIWSAVEFYRSGVKYSLGAIFWAANHEEMKAVLDAKYIDHILIKKSRIYDDLGEYHFGGYPRSFVEKLSNLDGWEKILENPEMVLWKTALP